MSQSDAASANHLHRSTYSGAVVRWLIERKLTDNSTRLRKARAELEVLVAQLGQFRDEADEARLHSIVSETSLAESDRRQSERHVDVFARERTRLVDSVVRYEKLQDELLDKLAADGAKRARTER